MTEKKELQSLGDKYKLSLESMEEYKAHPEKLIEDFGPLLKVDMPEITERGKNMLGNSWTPLESTGLFKTLPKVLGLVQMMAHSAFEELDKKAEAILLMENSKAVRREEAEHGKLDTFDNRPSSIGADGSSSIEHTSSSGSNGDIVRDNRLNLTDIGLNNPGVLRSISDSLGCLDPEYQELFERSAFYRLLSMHTCSRDKGRDAGSTDI